MKKEHITVRCRKDQIKRVESIQRDMDTTQADAFRHVVDKGLDTIEQTDGGYRRSVFDEVLMDFAMFFVFGAILMAAASVIYGENVFVLAAIFSFAAMGLWYVFFKRSTNQ